MLMKMRSLLASTVLLAGILLTGCATEQRSISKSSPEQPIELCRLSFLPPSGEEWEAWKDTTSPLEYALFKNIRGEKKPVFGIMVWQYRTDDPVNSEDDLWAYILRPYRDAVDADKRRIISKTECDHDESLIRVGLRCKVEGALDFEESYFEENFWATGLVKDGKAFAGEGHEYGFVLPDDDREIGVIEYFQQILPDVPPVDTGQRLSEFARNVTLME
jgi:hypothetical protein